MLRNRYKSPCTHCKREVAADAGALYGPGDANMVVCLDCLYNFYGEQRGLFAPLPGATSLFEGLITPPTRET